MTKIFLLLSILLNLILLSTLFYSMLDQGVTRTYQSDEFTHRIERDINSVLNKKTLEQKHFATMESGTIKVVFDGKRLKEIEIIRDRD